MVRDVALWIAVAVGVACGACLVGTLIRLTVESIRERRQLVRETVAHAEQVLAWEAAGHPCLDYAITCRSASRTAWWRVRGYWPELAATAERLSVEGYDGRPVAEVMISEFEPGHRHVRECTWEQGRMVSDTRRALRP